MSSISSIPKSDFSAVLSYLNTEDLIDCRLVSTKWKVGAEAASGKIDKTIPYIIREGLYGARFMHKDGPLYIRLEEVTEKNTKNWSAYKEWTQDMTYYGILETLFERANSEVDIPYDNSIGEKTGFTAGEYDQFQQSAKAAISKTNGKICRLLESNSNGSRWMRVSHECGDDLHIAYITNNHHFSIPDASNIDSQQRKLKNYIRLYDNLIISVGVGLNPTYWFMEGIFKNPLRVIDGRFSGVSMALPSLSAVVMSKYIQPNFFIGMRKDSKPKEEWLNVTPYASMQVIFSKSLKRGDGCYDRNKDITDVKVAPDAGICKRNRIKMSALIRIFKEITTGNIR